ncbi:MAG: ABC transporter permease [Proteobacteria bacterium]|nr:ABC transporter permease [Pseudomonadota bacterium]
MPRPIQYLLLGILALGLVFASLSEVFLAPANLFNIVLSASTIGILAVGAALVIGGAGLDLSVGALMALSAVTGVVLAQRLALPWQAILPLCLLCGALVGALNGLLIGYARILPLIVTLGMMSIARGLAYILTDGRPVYGLPDGILFLGQGSVAGVPVPVLIFAVVGVCAFFLLTATRFGRHTLALGSNETALARVGVNIARHKLLLYVLSGLLAAVAGLVFMTRVNAADPAAGLMYEMNAIAAAVIGGTPLFGGRASVAGAVLGALLMGVMQNGLTLLNMPAYYQEVAVGLVLIAAVALARTQGGGHAQR